MTKKTRLIILISCMVCFFTVAPILVYYSMGYRYDFAKMKVTKTGGIYVRTFPSAEEIIVDSKINEKPGFLSNEVFVQSLLPDLHTVLVKKEGYYDYFKTIPVEEELVTKLEEILLIKKDVKYVLASKEIKSPFDIEEKYILKNNNLYYSNSKENSALTATQKATPVLKKVSAFGLQNSSIIWLGNDGLLYKSDLSSLLLSPIQLNEKPVEITKNGTYKIFFDNQNIFLNNSGALLLLNKETKSLENFYSPAIGAKISPDGKNIAYWNGNYVYVSSIQEKPVKIGQLYKSETKIKELVWLNNSYIIFTTGDKIMISEIDYRGNVNVVQLPDSILIPADPNDKISKEKTITIKNPQIFFNQQENKLYILTEKTLIISEKLTP